MKCKHKNKMLSVYILHEGLKKKCHEMFTYSRVTSTWYVGCWKLCKSTV